MRSSERARDLGEVFTPPALVSEILSKIEDINYASKFLEPGCGNGNFLEVILENKLSQVMALPEVNSSLKSKDYGELECKSLLALASIYGIDIDELNVEEARERLLDVYKAWYGKVTTQELPDYLESAVSYVLSRNIIQGDLLGDTSKVHIVEFSELAGRRIKQLVFRFKDLIFPEDEVFEDNDMLFGHVPQHIHDLPIVHYKNLGRSDDNS